MDWVAYELALQDPAMWAAGLGFSAHWCWFIKGEHHMLAPIYALLLLILLPVLYIIELPIRDYDPAFALDTTLELFVHFLGSLFLSMVIYRVHFHNLHHFPGPFFARVSKLWHVWMTLDAKNHLFLEKLHREYGTFVRTGPNELTIFSPEGLDAMYGPGSNNVTKGDWFDAVLPLMSLANIRNPDIHDQRRSIWNEALSAKAVRNYEGRITKYADQLDQVLTETTGQPINVFDFFSFYTSDVMSDLAFGKAFGNILAKTPNASVQGVRQFMGVFGTLSPVPWFIRLGSGILQNLNGWKSFLGFVKQNLDARIMKEPPVPDVSSYLIARSMQNGTVEQDSNFLYGDALVLIVVGSDSMATTLIGIFKHLARYPIYQKQIRSELKTISSISNFSALRDLPILNSVIMETLRLWPSVGATGANRLVPEGGLKIAGKYIPAGTNIFAPRYVIARLESCFVRATEWIPDRWTSKPEMVKNKRATIPFGIGRYSCPGQRLSMAILTHLVARLVSKYDIEFAPGEDGSRVTDEMKDAFTLSPGPLDLVFKLRKDN